MSEATEILQRIFETFGFIIINSQNFWEVPCTIEISAQDSDHTEWNKVRIIGNATIQEWIAQCYGEGNPKAIENLGPYFYKAIAE